MSETYLIPKQLMERIGAYLAQRPFAEVAALFADINAQVKPLDEPPPQPETEP